MVNGMARQKKLSKPLHCNLELEVNEMLENFCEDSGQPKTVAVERAIKEYVQKYSKGIVKNETRRESDKIYNS